MGRDHPVPGFCSFPRGLGSAWGSASIARITVFDKTCLEFGPRLGRYPAAERGISRHQGNLRDHAAYAAIKRGDDNGVTPRVTSSPQPNAFRIYVG